MTRDEWLDATPTGWQSLVWELDAKLKERWPQYTISQVKEKFGTLRFYASPGLDATDCPDAIEDQASRARWLESNVAQFYEVINEYEEASAHVCEMCGAPGMLGVRRFWWATRCPECAPDGWSAREEQCAHPVIVDGECEDCGQARLARLEHADQVLVNTHLVGECAGQYCTIHNRSNHEMRSFPQHWRSDKVRMERVCPHGVGHPDPDEVALPGPLAGPEVMHACDGCCREGLL